MTGARIERATSLRGRHSDSASAAATYRDRIYRRYRSAFKGLSVDGHLASEFEARCRVYDHLLKDLRTEWSAKTLVEVACGQGSFLYWARQRGFGFVRGCDISAEQVEVAQALGLPAEVASYEDFLPRFSGQCDLVVGQDIIEHLSRDEGLHLLDLCHAALRPGGRLFLTMPNGAALRSGSVYRGDLTHETLFSPPSITLALKLAGFEAVEVREVAPPPTSIRARIRRLLWRLVRLVPLLVDLIETGACSTKVLTRVMAVCATRPHESSKDDGSAMSRPIV